MEDVEENSAISVNYLDFYDFFGQIFPKKIVFSMISENKYTKLVLKFQKIDFNVHVEQNIRISSKYKRIE